MIIKSLSRATKSFEALYNYLTREDNTLLNTFNLYSTPYNKEALIKEFLDNAEHLKKAKGKNYLYHEIISLNPNNLSLQEQQNILTDLVSKYISLRAENHLTFTALHKDKDHLHIHLMISANELEGNKRVRLSKKEFSTIQKELETYTNNIYPQLGQTKHYNKDLSKIKSKKEVLKSTLHDLFKKCSSKEDFKSSVIQLNRLNIHVQEFIYYMNILKDYKKKIQKFKNYFKLFYTILVKIVKIHLNWPMITLWILSLDVFYLKTLKWF